MPTGAEVSIHQQNILSVFSQATPQEAIHGKEWYFQANETARELGKKYAFPTPRVAGVLAALSPNQGWANNVAAAESVLDAVNKGIPATELYIATYPANRDKAYKIARGEARLTELYKSNKVPSFYRNIVSPWTSNSVTVDGHAFSIWEGSRVTLQNVPSRVFRNPTYSLIAGDYKSLAEDLGLLPWQVQATCWVTWRRLNGVSEMYDL